MTLSIRKFSYGYKYICEALGVQSRSYRTRDECITAARAQYPKAIITY